MKTKLSARVALSALLVVLLLLSVGVTLAYLHDEAGPLEEHFIPVEVACRVIMSDNEALAENVAVKNTGDITAYIRVAMVATWISDAGTTYGGAPIEGTDYTVGMADGWVKGSDGFYYCTAPVAAGDDTPILFWEVTAIGDGAPEGYSLSVQFLASAVQATPHEAVTSCWSGVTVAPDGTLTPPQ